MRGKAWRIACCVVVASFVVLAAAAPGWCAMAGKWKVTRVTKADVVITGIPEEHQKKTDNQTWTFKTTKQLDISDGTKGTWKQTSKTKFTADLKKAIEATWVALMKSKSLTGTAKIVDAKYVFSGIEKSKTSMSGKLDYEVLLTVTAPISTSGKAVVKSTFKGKRITKMAIETESDVMNAILDGLDDL